MYTIYLNYWDNNEVVAQTSTKYQAQKLCMKLTTINEKFIVWYTKQQEFVIFELMCFEEHYQNLLTFEQNTEIFIKHLKINQLWDAIIQEI